MPPTNQVAATLSPNPPKQVLPLAQISLSGSLRRPRRMAWRKGRAGRLESQKKKNGKKEAIANNCLCPEGLFFILECYSRRTEQQPVDLI